MVNEESRVTLYQDYVALCVKVLAESYVKCHGGKLELPSFYEMTHEKEKEESAEHIIERLRKKFAGE